MGRTVETVFRDRFIQVGLKISELYKQQAKIEALPRQSSHDMRRWRRLMGKIDRLVALEHRIVRQMKIYCSRRG